MHNNLLYFNKKRNTLYIEITSKCNLNCSYCYNNSKISNSMYLDKEVLKSTINPSIHELGLKTVVLSGGEPFLHPNLSEICSYVHNAGANLTINTNATILSKEIIDEIKIFKPNFQIAIESHEEEVINKYKGGNAYIRMINGIKIIKEHYDIRKLAIRCNLTNELFDSEKLKEYVKFLNELGIKNAYISLMACEGRAQNLSYPTIMYDYKKINDIKKELEEYVSSYDMSFTFPFASASMICPYAQTKTYNGDYFFHVSYNGGVYPCGALLNEDFCLGNIKEEHINDILLGGKMNEFINKSHKRLRNIDSCKNCIVDSVCGKGCISECIKHEDFYGIDGHCKMRKQEIYDILKSKVI